MYIRGQTLNLGDKVQSVKKCEKSVQKVCKKYMTFI